MARQVSLQASTKCDAYIHSRPVPRTKQGSDPSQEKEAQRGTFSVYKDLYNSLLSPSGILNCPPFVSQNTTNTLSLSARMGPSLWTTCRFVVASMVWKLSAVVAKKTTYEIAAPNSFCASHAETMSTVTGGCENARGRTPH